MTEARVRLKRTLTAGAAPAASEFLEGELILNLPDRKLFARDSSNAVFEVGKPVEISFVIRAVFSDDEIAVPPSGVEGAWLYNAPNNGDLVAVNASGNGTQYGGVWIYNTTGAWTRPPSWANGTRHANGTLFIVSTTSANYILSCTAGTESYFTVDSTTVISVSQTFLAIQGAFSSLTEAEFVSAPINIIYNINGTLRLKLPGAPDEHIILGNPSFMFEARTDCVSTTNTNDFTHTTSGTGAAFSSLAIGADDAVGILRWASGTVATNRCSIASPNFSIIRLSKGLARFTARHRLPVLSDATNTYTTRIGFIDSITAESADGVFFRYTNAVNGGRFQAVTRNNNAESVFDCGGVGNPSANTWMRFSIEVNPAGTNVIYRINDSVVANISTNIPIVSGRELGYGVYTQRTVGTASINMADTDYVQVQQVFTTRR